MIAGAFWFVQVVEGSYYRDLAENNRLRKLALEAPRGAIYDRNGRVLVENLPSYNLLLDRSRARDLGASLELRRRRCSSGRGGAASAARALPAASRRSSRCCSPRA